MFNVDDRVMILNAPIHTVKPGDVGKIHATGFISPITKRDYSYVELNKDSYTFAIYNQDITRI